MNVTEARAAFAPERVPFEFRGKQLEALEPSFALRVSLAKERGLAADVPLVAAVVVVPGTEERVFQKPSDVLEAGGSKVAELIEIVREICQRWAPPAPAAPAATPKVSTEPMEVPESAKSAAAAQG